MEIPLLSFNGGVVFSRNPAKTIPMGSRQRQNSCLAVLAIVLFCGCTRPTTPADTLVVGLSSQPASLNPLLASDAYGMRITHLIYNSLVKIGPHLDVEPEAATSWSFRDNTYTFKLVPGLKFQNGRPVTTEDLLYTLAQFTSSKSVFASGLADIDTYSAVMKDDHLEISIHLRKYVANFLRADLPVIRILPRAESLQTPGILLGTGSYRLRQNSDSEIDLDAVDSHPLTTPRLRHVAFKIVRDDFTRYQKLLKGELDAVFTDLSPDKVKVFERQSDRFRVFHFPGASINYILMNFRDPLLAMPEVRQALNLAINRPEIIQYKLEGMADEATAIVPKSIPEFNTSLKNPPYDSKAAAAIIQRLGLTGKHLTLKCSNNPSAIDTAKVIAYQMSRIGLQVELQTFEWGKLYSDLNKGNFQLAMGKWVGISDPFIYHTAFASSEFPPGRNRGYYHSPEVDQLLVEAEQTHDPSQRRSLYLEVERKVFDDIAVIPLWYDHQTAVMSKTIDGYEPAQAGDFDPLLKMSKHETGLLARDRAL